MTIGCLTFGVIGLCGALATTLVPAVRIMFGLNLSQAIAVQWIALVVSSVASLPLAQALQRHGAARILITGLALLIVGCGAVWLVVTGPGQGIHTYDALLGALSLVALEITALQVAANLLVVELGKGAAGAGLLTLAQGFNSLGVLAGVHLGAGLILGAGQGKDAGTALAFSRGAGRAYLLCGAASLAVFGILLFWRKSMDVAAPARERGGPIEPLSTTLRSGWALAGAGTIALYVGAEGSIGSVLIGYLHQDPVLGLSLSEAGQWVANGYWGGALAGRFVGSLALARTKSAPTLLAVTAGLAAGACLVVVIGTGKVAAAAALATGACNAIMFPVIFATTVARSSAPAAAVSGLLNMAIGGGAAISVAVGLVADRYGMAWSFVVPLSAYLLVGTFALCAVNPPAGRRRTRE